LGNQKINKNKSQKQKSIVMNIVTRSSHHPQPEVKVSNHFPIPKKGFIYNLRKNGFKIRVRHYRHAIAAVTSERTGMGYDKPGLYLVTKDNRKQYSHIQSTGGITELDITFPDGTNVTSKAICSEVDSYCKRLGCYIAFKRAVEIKRSHVQPDLE
jgi:hypothetical protein